MDSKLFDPERAISADPRDAVRIVHAFLEKCAAWAEERELPRRIADLGADPSPDKAAKVHAWSSWLAFVRHAQRELEAGELDDWFRT